MIRPYIPTCSEIDPLLIIERLDLTTNCNFYAHKKPPFIFFGHSLRAKKGRESKIDAHEKK